MGQRLIHLEVQHELPILWTGYRKNVARVICPRFGWNRRLHKYPGIGIRRCYDCFYYIDRTKETLYCAHRYVGSHAKEGVNVSE